MIRIRKQKNMARKLCKNGADQIKAEFISVGAMLALELVIIISAVLAGNNYTSNKKNCTEPLDAVVTSVSGERVLSQMGF